MMMDTPRATNTEATISAEAQISALWELLSNPVYMNTIGACAARRARSMQLPLALLLALPLACACQPQADATRPLKSTRMRLA